MCVRKSDPVDAPPSVEAVPALRAAETIGRPLRSDAFLDHVAALAGRDPKTAQARAEANQ
jgi:hypothetical protein